MTTRSAVGRKKPTARKTSSRKKAARKAKPRLLAEVHKREPEPLRACAETAFRNYFETLNGHKPANLYDMVMDEVEAPLLSTVMEYVGGNQTRASEILGINRGTLRKKLRHHGLDR